MEEQDEIGVELPGSVRQVAKVLLAAMEARESYSRGHCERAAILAVNIAHQMRMARQEVMNLKLAALLHDVGKIGIPGEILHKPGNLSQQERALIQSHVEIGLKIIEQAGFPQEILPIIAQHHERMDGTGYPLALRAEEIVPAARILGVADTFDAMISSRPYRPPLEIDIVMAYFWHVAGISFDFSVVEALVKVVKKEGSSGGPPQGARL